MKTVAILGAGTMGHGIAQVAAQSGCETRVFDVSQTQLDRARELVAKNLAVAVEKQKATAEERDAALSRLSFTTELGEAVRGAQLVIEAVPENLRLKKDLLGQAAQLAPTALLGTNTSSLSVTEIASGLPDPSRLVGTHFFNPPYAMKLLELVRGERTSPAAIDEARAMGQLLGRELIVVNDVPGFATSRLGLALGLEAIRMLEQGVASAEDIDRGMELGYRHPMGPLRLTDLVGLDVRLAIAEYLHRELGEQFRPPALLRRMVRAGKLGKKSGEGFYRW